MTTVWPMSSLTGILMMGCLAWPGLELPQVGRIFLSLYTNNAASEVGNQYWQIKNASH